ncbi:FK506-binding protein 1, putative [Eimeria tenella]|uniref:peptidylprolyl isomerase n=1 Tax=Eimeria tenella TaxID=5802 RepID=U6KLW7_EIMTE|nr:FK506-binding protein 1, putative [Eimeria tenella]CDJ39097.1 FK506-binding protein 1, putative [Eimeria tenella]|eukprot:XP_013229852.1 FK506-binding protein 1, putative [Eimeria tenella]
MEGKGQEQNARQRANVRHGVRPPIVEPSKQPQNSSASKPSSRSKFFIFSCFFIASFVVGVIVCSHFLRPKSASVLPANLEELFARAAHLVIPSKPSDQTTSSEPEQRKMAPLTELKTSVVKPGSGPTVAKGQRVTVHATGSVLQPDGATKKFWSTKDPGQQPFTWQAGLGQVIAGWDQGVIGMNQGETRMIYIPARMGYGQNGFPAWGIPPNADLQFEIECLQIQ